MKQIVLIRHSKTEVIYEGIGDFERNLKTRGRKDAQLVTKHIKEKGFSPDLLISSSANRAHQTTEEIAKVFNYPQDKIITESFLYDGYTTSEFLNYISKLDNTVESVWIVGHNPDIALIAMNLTNDDFFHYPTSGTAIISFNVDNWNKIEAREGKSVYFITPRQLKDDE